MSEDRDVVRILVVDDEAPIRELIRRWLLEWGYDVTLATNAEDALGTLMWRPVSVIVTDMRLPGENGLWLLEHVKAKLPQTRFIVVSGLDDMTETVSRQLRADHIDVLLKPFSREEFRGALDRVASTIGQL